MEERFPYGEASAEVSHVQLPLSINQRLIDNSSYASPGYGKTFPEEVLMCRSMTFYAVLLKIMRQLVTALETTSTGTLSKHYFILDSITLLNIYCYCIL